MSEFQRRLSYLNLKDRMFVSRHRVNKDGYDSSGAYWGSGERLYHIMDWDGKVFFWRAKDRISMIEMIKAEYKDVRLW